MFGAPGGAGPHEPSGRARGPTRGPLHSIARMSEPAGRDRLLQLMRERALIRESVVLASGKRSSHYFDARQVLLDPEGAEIAGAIGYELLRELSPAAVGGPTSAADPLVCAISTAAWRDGVRWTGFFVRKEAKKYGLQNWIEGPFLEEGTPVVVVDDTLTTGGSVIGAVEKARAAGAEVVGALVAIDREEGGREAVEGSLDGAPLLALFTASEIIGE